MRRCRCGGHASARTDAGVTAAVNTTPATATGGWFLQCRTTSPAHTDQPLEPPPSNAARRGSGLPDRDSTGAGAASGAGADGS